MRHNTILYGVALVLFCGITFSAAQEAETAPHLDMDNILSMPERAAVMQEWLEWRLEHILPAVMRREGIDLWLIICGENNEDPVYLTLMPEPALMAAGTTFLVFHDLGEEQGIERFASGAYVPLGSLYKRLPTLNKEDRFANLAQFIQQRNPRKIGINVSDNWHFGDGLAASKEKKLRESLGPSLADRLVSAENVCVGWLETRSPQELSVYRHICGIAHDMIAEMFSNRVIIPDVTTSDDVVWWWRQKVNDLGLRTWFQPTLRIHRYVEGEGVKAIGYDRREEVKPEDKIIRRGDLIHCDVGLVYLGLATDNQQLAYVCRVGEDRAPAGLEQGLKNTNRLQDIFMREFRAGRSGYETALAAAEKAEAEGLKPLIYSHPIGYHGHGAGPPLGSYRRGIRRSVRADYPIHVNTCYSIELNNATLVPEWGNGEVKFALEEEAAFTLEGCWFVDGRETKLYLIK
jgi:Xaa-Pro aminopeptidase